MKYLLLLLMFVGCTSRDTSISPDRHVDMGGMGTLDYTIVCIDEISYIATETSYHYYTLTPKLNKNSKVGLCK